MHFTVVFEAHQSRDASYGLVFVPCAQWVRGDEVVVDLHPDRGGYEKGDLNALLAHEGLCDRLEGNAAVLVVHSSGVGGERDLDALVADLKGEGFVVRTV